MNRFAINALARSAALAAVLVVLCPVARAQDDATPPADTVAAALDSSLLREYQMTKSPTLAVLFSIVPGGGQIYNEQYFKAAAFFGAGAFFASQAVYFHQRFITKAREVDAIPIDSVDQRAYPRALREFYRDQRDLNAAYFLGVTVLSMIDAYVGAHLFDFDVSGGEVEGSSRLELDPTRPAIGLSVRF
jgi:hypothetical protein